MNKKAGAGGIIGSIALFLVVIIILLAVANQNSSNALTQFFSSIHLDSAKNVVNGIINFFTAIKEALMNLAVPESAGLNADQEVIAFGIFLLMWIIGTHALNQAMQKPILGFVAAGLVSLIACRGLSVTIIDNYIINSPIAAGAFLVGVLPVFGFYGIMSKWASGKLLTKTLAWCIFAMTYFVIFFFGFQSKTLGITYAIAILIAGFGEVLAPYIVYYRRTANAKSIGKFLATTHKDWQNFETAYSEYEQGITRVKPKAPWEI